jgi:hypothetical protein
MSDTQLSKAYLDSMRALQEKLKETNLLVHKY